MAIVVVVIAAWGAYKIYKRQRKRKPKLITKRKALVWYEEPQNVIHNGVLGPIYRGQYRGIDAVVKSSRYSSGRVSHNDAAIVLRHEAKMLARAVHRNVAALFGMIDTTTERKHDGNSTMSTTITGCGTGMGEVTIVLALYSLGNLEELLRCTNAHRELDVAARVRIAVDVARALAHLDKLQLVHRNVAARSCLVATDGSVRLGSFGLCSPADRDGLVRMEANERDMAREFAYARLPPECTEGNVCEFSTASDIFMFGHLLYELLTNGADPWADTPNEALISSRIQQGDMPDKPPDAPDELRILMAACWSRIVAFRPRAKRIVKRLAKLLDELPPSTARWSLFTPLGAGVAVADSPTSVNTTADERSE